MLPLSPRDDDEEDNHLCIKCNATIMGLDNYVKHRKERCRKMKYDNISSEKRRHVKGDNEPHIDSLDQQYNLGADVFFQSLELQSSSKRNPSARATPPIHVGGKVGAGVMTRRAAAALLLPTSSSRNVTTVSPVEATARGEDWIGGHSLKVMSTGDNQTKLINAVANISGSVKKETATTSYSIMDDYKPDDDFNEDSEDSDDIEDDEAHASGGKWKPPHNFTGGKWQPGRPETVHHWNSARRVSPEPDHDEDWGIQEEHSGGKWKPIIPQNLRRLDDDEEDAYMPPPGHTKGKWIPGAKENSKNYHKLHIMETTVQSKGTVQYWCGPCNRRLGSRVIYERHLMSNLHLKRTLPEHDLEYSGHLKNTQETLGKRTTRPSHYVDNSLYTQINRKKKSKGIKLDTKVAIKKRARRPTFVHCPGCKSRVRPHLMGKHLISHYHFRKVTVTDQSYTELILDNIEAIVHQSPFQCSPCKFYTNWQSSFLQHCFSADHNERIDGMEGKNWCSFCKFECETNGDMIRHITGTEHQDVVAAINRSMPIIIRKKSILTCGVCGEVFRYNVALKYHSSVTGHEVAHTASDEYQELHKCEFCHLSCKSSLTLSAHLKRDHKQREFFCLVCSLSFKTTLEAKQHRKSQQHKIRHKEILIDKGLIKKDMTKQCPYCQSPRFKNILELKRHIEVIHPDNKHKCPRCGMSFTLSQEVSLHIKKKACNFQQDKYASSSSIWKCSQCLFQTDSQAECFFHEVLHTEPIAVKGRDGDVEKILLKYKCPLCYKLFLKPSLRCHIRQHTCERPYVCNVCQASFTRQGSLTNHFKTTHEGLNVASTSKVSTIPLPKCSVPNLNKAILMDEKRFLCSDCGVSFSTKHSLHRHTSTHSSSGASRLPCPHLGCSHAARSRHELSQHQAAAHSTERPHACRYPDCTYAAKTTQQLARHSKIHGSRIRKFSCPSCDYRSDHSAQMKRHARLHTGDKPYSCPHCRFRCNSLENLRKHIFKTNKHRGKPLYQCKDCPPKGYSTNFASELRNHLVKEHGGKYNNRTAAEYVAQYCMKPVNETSDEKYIHTFEDSSQVRENIESSNHSNTTGNDMDSGIKTSLMEGYYSVSETGTLIPFYNTS